MADGRILDSQMSASSTASPVVNARPYKNGWCPEFSDHQPFIKVSHAVNARLTFDLSYRNQDPNTIYTNQHNTPSTILSETRHKRATLD